MHFISLYTGTCWGLHYLPPSFAFFLPPSLSLADCHSHHGRDDPLSVSKFAPLCSPLASWGKHLRVRPSIIGLTAGPRRGRPCYLDSVMTSSKRGPSFPHRPGMAEVWFGASIPSLHVHRKHIGFTGRMFGSR